MRLLGARGESAAVRRGCTCIPVLTAARGALCAARELRPRAGRRHAHLVVGWAATSQRLDFSFLPRLEEEQEEEEAPNRRPGVSANAPRTCRGAALLDRSYTVLLNNPFFPPQAARSLKNSCGAHRPSEMYAGRRADTIACSLQSALASRPAPGPGRAPAPCAPRGTCTLGYELGCARPG